MKPLRRLFVWSLFLGLPVAIGAGVFHFVRYQPRFAVAESHEMPHLSADGRWLLTVETDIEALIADNFDGPTRLQVFDTREGCRVWSFDVSSATRCMPSPALGAVEVDGHGQQRCVAVCRGENAAIIDWQRG